jgi:hypothetical protein
MARKKGMVALGVVFAVIGIFVLIPSAVSYNAATNRIQQCATLLGQLGQGLDANTAQMCNEASAAQPGYLGSLVLGIIIFLGSIAGVVLIKVDDRKKKEQQLQFVT